MESVIAPTVPLPAVGSPYLGGNEIEFLHDGEAIYEGMLAAIDAAERTVDLESYAWWSGSVTERFADALRKAARRGVRVRLLIDLMGARLASDPTLYELDDDGVQVATFRRPSLRRPSTLSHRSHRRIMVVDQETGFTGGAGIGDEWLDGGGEYPSSWRDLHARMRGPLVQLLQSEFTQDFAIARSDPSIKKPAVLEPVEGGIKATLVKSVPQPDRTPVAIAFQSVLAAAEASVDIYSAFLAPHPDVMNPLLHARARGVRVRLLLPSHDHVDKRLSAYTAEAAFPALLDAGVDIYRYRPSMLHAKATVVDGRLVTFGTPNLNGRSFQRDRELMVVAADERLGSGLARRFEQDLGDAERVTTVEPDTLRGKVARASFDRITHLLSSHV